VYCFWSGGKLTALMSLLFEGGVGEGAPQNQSGGVNNTFNSDGTNSITTGANATPVNWYSVAPQVGVGALYTIAFTDTGLSSGTALVILNNGATFSLSTSQFPSPSGGIGGRNFSYVIKNLAGTTVASGTGTTRNDL